MAEANKKLMRFIDNLLEEDLVVELSAITKGRKIGGGMYGKVFLGTYNGRQVAIKEIEIVNGAARYIMGEIAILKKLRGREHIVDFYGVCKDRRNILLILEYVNGGDLEKLLFKKPILSNNEYLQIAKQILTGIIELHESNIIHRDLKPENILIKKEGDTLIAKLGDFGISRSYLPLQMMTAEVGTPIYRAPEVATTKYSYAADIYSFGLILREIFTRKRPFPPQFDEYQPAPKRIVPPPDQIAEIAQQCIRLNPEERPTATVVLEQLNAIQFPDVVVNNAQNQQVQNAPLVQPIPVASNQRNQNAPQIKPNQSNQNNQNNQNQNSPQPKNVASNRNNQIQNVPQVKPIPVASNQQNQNQNAPQIKPNQSNQINQNNQNQNPPQPKNVPSNQNNQNNQNQNPPQPKNVPSNQNNQNNQNQNPPQPKNVAIQNVPQVKPIPVASNQQVQNVPQVQPIPVASNQNQNNNAPEEIIEEDNYYNDCCEIEQSYSVDPEDSDYLQFWKPSRVFTDPNLANILVYRFEKESSPNLAECYYSVICQILHGKGDWIRFHIWDYPVSSFYHDCDSAFIRYAMKGFGANNLMHSVIIHIPYSTIANGNYSKLREMNDNLKIVGHKPVLIVFDDQNLNDDSQLALRYSLADATGISFSCVFILKPFPEDTISLVKALIKALNRADEYITVKLDQLPFVE